MLIFQLWGVYDPFTANIMNNKGYFGNLKQFYIGNLLYLLYCLTKITVFKSITSHSVFFKKSNSKKGGKLKKMVYISFFCQSYF